MDELNIADLEQNQATPPVCQYQSYINDNELRRKLTHIEQKIAELQTRQGQLYQAVKACPLSHQQLSQERKVPIPYSGPIYHSSLCQNISIYYENAIFKYCRTNPHTPYGTLRPLQPFTPDCASFSIEILHSGDIAMGVWYNDGIVLPTVGYHAETGRIDDKRDKTTMDVPKCEKGDTIMCRLDYQTHSIEFLRNGVHEHTIPCKQVHRDIHLLYPYIELKGIGAAVRPLEIEPWRC